MQKSVSDSASVILHRSVLTAAPRPRAVDCMLCSVETLAVKGLSKSKHHSVIQCRKVAGTLIIVYSERNLFIFSFIFIWSSQSVK